MLKIEDLTSELVKFKTINPKGESENFYDCVKFISEYFSQNGFSAEIKEFEKGWPTIIVKNNKDGKSILLNGHYDVVPIGDITKWKYDPFSGKIVDNKVFGRGSTDMKGGLAVLINTFIKVADKIDYNLIFTAVPDEETGGQKGSKYLAQLFSPDFVIVGEPTQGLINIGEKGLLQVKIIQKGKSAHGSMPSLGENAIMKLVNDLVSLQKIQEIKINIPQEVEEGSQTLSNINPLLGNELKRISFNPGVIKGGIKVNVVPDLAEAEIDMRIPPGISSEKALASVKELIKGDLEILDISEPSYSKGNYIDKFKEIVNAKTFLTTYATDGRYFRYKEIQTIAYGPGELNQLHSYNEYVKIDDLKFVEKNLEEYLTSIKF